MTTRGTTAQPTLIDPQTSDAIQRQSGTYRPPIRPMEVGAALGQRYIVRQGRQLALDFPWEEINR
jgi:hypothetical protein